MSEISDRAKSDDEEVAAESTDGNEQQEVEESTTDTGNEPNEGGKQRLSNEERRVKREMARVKMETIGPVNWDVDKIFKGLERPCDVTAAVLRVLARHNIIHRENTLRRYKAALAHCINSKPTRIPGVRVYTKARKPTLEGLSCLPVTEYDYKILQAAKFFRIKVTTLNKLLIELDALVPSKNIPPLLELAERTESECSNDEEDEGDSSDEAKKEPEENELPNELIEKEEEDSETEAELEKETDNDMPIIVRCDAVGIVDEMPTIVHCNADDVVADGGGTESAEMPTIVRSDAVVDGGTESAGEDEPVEEAVWDRPMDEGTTFGGDYLDKTKSKEERLRSFVWQIMYHVTDDDGRQCIEWMIKSMLDPKEFAKIPSIYHKTKVLEFYKVILPSLHMAEDFYPVRVDFAPLCGTRTLRFDRGPGLFDSDDEKAERDDDEEEDDLDWMKVLEEARKEREEYAMERDIRREMGIPSDSDDWPESDEDEEVDVERIDDEETNGGKASTEGEESERSKEKGMNMKEDTATEDSTTDSRETDDVDDDDVTSSAMGGMMDDREETPGESGGDADDEGSTDNMPPPSPPQVYHDYEDREDDDDTVEEGGGDGEDEDDDGVEWMVDDGKTIEKRTRQEKRGEETVEKEDEEIEVIYVDDEKDNGKGEKKEMRKGKDEKGRKKEHDVITLEEEEDDDDDDFHSVRSRPSEETEADATTTAVPPLAPLIAPLPARPAGDGTEEEGDGYATVMEGREEEDNDVTLIEQPSPTANNGDARDDSPASPEPDNRSYGDDDDDDEEGEEREGDWEMVDDHDYCGRGTLERVRRPQNGVIEMAQPATPQEPERKKRKVIDDDDDEVEVEKEKEEQPVRRSMRGKASPAPILPPPKRSYSRKKKEVEDKEKEEKRKKEEMAVVEKVTVKEEVVDEGEEEGQTSSGKRGRGRPKKINSFRDLWREQMVLPTAAMGKTSEEADGMDGDGKGASEKEPTPAVQQQRARRGRKTSEVRRDIKREVPDGDDDDGVAVVAVVPSSSGGGGSSRASSTRGRTPRGRTPAKKATTPVPARGRTPAKKTPVKQKTTTPVPEKEAKKSAAQKRMETMENVKLIMAMNKDFAGNGLTTPDQSSTGKRIRPRGGSSSSTVKKEVDGEGDDDVAIVDSPVDSSGGLRRSTRGRAPTKELSTPDLPVTKRRVGRPPIVKLEPKEEVVDVEEDVSSTVSSSQRRQPRGRTPRGRTPAKKTPVKQVDAEDVSGTVFPVRRRGRTPGGGRTPADEGSNTVSSSHTKQSRGRTPRAKTPVGRHKATTPPEPKNRRNKGEGGGGKGVEAKKELAADGGDDEDVRIIGTKSARVKTPRGRTPAQQKATTLSAAASQPSVKGVNKEMKQGDLMALVSTAEARTEPSTPDMARVKGSGAEEKGMSDRKRSLRGHKDEAKKAVEPVEVIDLEDDDEEEKREEEAPMQQSDQRRRSLRAGGSRGGTASLRESGPVASFSMPPAQPRRRSQQK
uniref:Uncharacterized protein n=1 Tax=Pristionchus pacificus TaxID=54126 RepID=A0A8R1UKX9_PRIPA